MIKKILLVILALLVVLVAVFFLGGLLSPTNNLETRITINKPRPDVWRLFNDETKMGEWLTGFKSIEKISGERNSVGSKYRLRFTENGRDIEMTEEMKEFRAPEAFAFHLDSEILSDDVRIVMNDQGDKTEVVQTDSVTGANMFWKSMCYWTKSHFRDATRANLESLKKYVETAK